MELNMGFLNGLPSGNPFLTGPVSPRKYPLTAAEDGADEQKIKKLLNKNDHEIKEGRNGNWISQYYYKKHMGHLESYQWLGRTLGILFESDFDAHVISFIKGYFVVLTMMVVLADTPSLMMKFTMVLSVTAVVGYKPLKVFYDCYKNS